MNTVPKKIVIKTDRLRLRELDAGDVSFIIELLNTPGWLKYIGDRHVRNNEEAIGYLENGPLKSYKVNGFGLYLVEPNAGGAPMGMCGILKRDSLDFPDLGFAFLPEYSGKGFAIEAASAVLTYAHTQLNFPKIAAITMPENKNSLNLLSKLGFKQVKITTMGSEDLLLLEHIKS